MLKDPKYNDPNEREILLGMMNISIEKFKGTIQSLEDINKVQKNPKEEFKTIIFSDVLELIISDLNDKIKTSGALTNKNFNECESVYFSENKLYTILFNLLDNSIKFREPMRKLIVEIKSWITEDGYVALYVKDNGLGFKNDKKEKIFSMFKKMHDNQDGMGIGLYVVKRIIEDAGGYIEVESDPGKGSTFTMYFRKALNNS